MEVVDALPPLSMKGVRIKNMVVFAMPPVKWRPRKIIKSTKDTLFSPAALSPLLKSQVTPTEVSSP